MSPWDLVVPIPSINLIAQFVQYKIVRLYAQVHVASSNIMISKSIVPQGIGLLSIDSNLA